MRLFNIGAEGQLYLGAIFGSRGGALPRRHRRPVVARDRRDGRRRCARRCALGADPGRAAGVLQDERDHHLADAQLRRRVPAHVPDLRERVVLARHRRASTRRCSRPARTLPNSAIWPSWTIHVQGGIAIPLGLVSRCVIAVGAVGALHADAVRVRGAGAERLRARGALRRRPDPAEDPRGDGDLRRRSPASAARARSATSATRSTATRTACRSSATATRASSSPRSPATTRSPSLLVAFLIGGLENAGQHAPGRRLPGRARRRDPGDHPLLRARRRAARPLPRAARAARRRPSPRRRQAPHEPHRCSSS